MHRKRQQLREKKERKKSAAKKLNRLEPVSALFPATVRGVTSEVFADTVADYVRENPDGLLRQIPVSKKVCRHGLAHKL